MKDDCCAPKGDFDLAVIGAGSAGFSAAITAAEEGKRVALIGTGLLTIALGLLAYDIAGDQAIQVGGGAGATHPVLVHRRQVEHAGGAANSEVFKLHIDVGIRRRVALPVTPAVEFAGLGHPRVERRGQHHPVIAAHRPRPPRSISRAALPPASPLSPPPGWAPAPQRNSLSMGVSYWAAP